MISPPVLPKAVALQLAKFAGVPVATRDIFYEFVSNSFQRIWKRDRRAVSSQPGPALKKAAKAARTLHEAFHALNPQDRVWVDNIASSQLQFLGGEGHHLELTIWNIASLFTGAIGRPAPFLPLILVLGWANGG